MKNTNAIISTYFCSRCIYYYSSISRTIVHSSKISYSQLYLVINSFINDNSIKQCMNECRKYYSPLSHLTIGKYYKKFRSLLNFFVKDEMRIWFWRVQWKLMRRCFKFKRGQANGTPLLEFGFLALSRTTDHFVIYPLTSRKKDILYSIILKHVPYRSIIFSDCWGAYVNNKVTPKTSLLTSFGYIQSAIFRITYISKPWRDYGAQLKNMWGFSILVYSFMNISAKLILIKLEIVISY